MLASVLFTLVVYAAIAPNRHATFTVRGPAWRTSTSSTARAESYSASGQRVPVAPPVSSLRLPTIVHLPWDAPSDDFCSFLRAGRTAAGPPCAADLRHGLELRRCRRSRTSQQSRRTRPHVPDT